MKRKRVSMGNVDTLAKEKIAVNKSKKAKKNISKHFADVLCEGLIIEHSPVDHNNVYQRSKEVIMTTKSRNIPGSRDALFRTPSFNFWGNIGDGGLLGRNYSSKDVEPEKSEELVYITIDAGENSLDSSYQEMEWAKTYFEDLKDLGEYARKIFEDIYDYLLYTCEIQSSNKLDLLMRELTDEEQDALDLERKLPNGKPDLSGVPKEYLDRIRNDFINNKACHHSVFRRLGEDGKPILYSQLHKKYGKKYPTNKFYDNFIEIPGTTRQLIFKRRSYANVGVDAIINTFPSEIIEQCRERNCKTDDEKTEFIKNYYANKYSYDFSAIKKNMEELEDPIKRKHWNETNGFKLKPVKVYTNQNGKFVLVDSDKLKKNQKSIINYGDIVRCFVKIQPYSMPDHYGMKGILGNEGFIFVAKKPPSYTDLGEATDEMSYYGDYNNNNIELKKNENQEEEEEEEDSIMEDNDNVNNEVIISEDSNDSEKSDDESEEDDV